MKINQVKEISLYVTDLDRTEAFYQGKLGFPVISRVNGRHIFFRVGHSVLLCFIPGATRKGSLPAHYAEGKIHIAFEVSDKQYREAKEWIRSLEISIEHEQKWHDGYFSIYFRDPDGHSLEIVPEGLWG